MERERKHKDAHAERDEADRHERTDVGPRCGQLTHKVVYWAVAVFEEAAKDRGDREDCRPDDPGQRESSRVQSSSTVTKRTRDSPTFSRSWISGSSVMSVNHVKPSS